ncbi:MAG: lytic transglycosylase domain-containing protein [Armatimonadota bacterium]|nr:lytic transglycosylase domain-containing protein [Armatimonadota bacterium]
MTARRRPGAALVAGLCGALLLAARADAATLRDGAARFAQGRLGDAEALFTLAASQRPTDPYAWLWLGVVQFHRGDVLRAHRSVARAADLAPHEATILLWQGHLLARSGRAEEAASAFRQALSARGSPEVRQMAEQALRAVGPLPAPLEAQVAQTRALSPGRAAAWVLSVRSYDLIARSYNPRLAAREADLIAHALLGYSRQFNLDPRLVVALVVIESGFQPTARSRAGAMGLGQLMPQTARALGVNPWDPVQNLYGTIRYLRGALDQFRWDAHLALAAYNAGRGAVERYEGIPPYAETQWYVANVTALYRRLLSIPGEIGELRRRLGEN